MSQRIVDLSLRISDNMPTHKYFQSPVHVPHWTHESSTPKGTPEDPLTFATSYVGMLDHAGTHVDAYYHFSPAGLKVADMPIEMFFGKAVCLDVSHIGDLEDIDVADLEKAEAASGVHIDGHIVLLCTGFHKRHWPNPSVTLSNPGLTAAATHWLADHGSKVHGVEGPSTDRPNHDAFPNHRVCRDRKITHYEWLVNLDQLVGLGEFTFYGVPIALENGTGGPCRAFAILS